jgi:tetratricopeptide (TPR) repeat protein
MNMCPQREALADWLDGVLDPVRSHVLRGHITSCDACLGTLDRLTDDPELDDWMSDGGWSATPSVRRELLAAIAPRTPDLAVSALGHYAIEEEVGRGGMGVVYRARDRALGRLVALKVLRAGPTDVRARDRFLREARAAGRVEHDHIVRVYATSDPSDAVPYLAMEYLAGASLATRLRTCGRLAPREAALVAAQVADGLAAAHAAGLVHRDVKPDNILFDPATGRAKIGDFGLARLAAEAAHLTGEGSVAGTPAYLSPEQTRSDREIGPFADVYALGVTLYECLAGEPPFRGTPHRIIQQILDDDPRPPRAINEAVPRDMETICLKAMAKEPAHRYTGAAELAADLRRWLAGEPIRARPAGPFGRLARLARRRPGMSLLAASLALATGLGVAGIAWQWRRAEANAHRYREATLHAEADYRQARDAVDRFYTRMIVNQTLDRPGLEPARAEVVRALLDYYRAFLARHDRDPVLRADAAAASLRVGELTRNVGDKRDALAALNQARSLLEALVRENPGALRSRQDLALCLDLTCGALFALGRGEEAIAAGRAACEAWRRVLAITPGDTNSRLKLGAALGNLANAYTVSGLAAEARATYRLAREQHEILLRLNPADQQHRAHLGLTLHNAAFLIENPEARLAAFDEALAQRRKLSTDHPENCYHRRNVARTLDAMGRVLSTLGDHATALTRYEEACALLRASVRDVPSLLYMRRDLAEALANRTSALTALGRAGEAVDVAQEGLALVAELARTDPADTQTRSLRASLHSRRASAFETLGRRDDARTERQTALDLLRELSRDHPDNPHFRPAVETEAAALDKLARTAISS